jgi:integrase
VSPASVRNALAPLRALFATAFEEGVIRSNPAAGVRIAHHVDQEHEDEHAKALTEEELRALLDRTRKSGGCSSSSSPTPGYGSAKRAP